MANYFVASGGSATAPYDTWAKAATSLATALAAASAAGDNVVLQYNAVPTGDAELSADTTYTFAAENVSLIAASNDGGSAYTPTAMGTGTWVGNSTTNRSVTIAGANKKFIYGVTLRTSGSTSDSITLANDDGADDEYEDCYFWHGNTNSASRIAIGADSSSANVCARLRNCTLRFGATTTGIAARGRLFITGGSVSSAGSAPANLFVVSLRAPGVHCMGVDLSHVTGALVSAGGGGSQSYIFECCKLGSGVTRLAAQTVANEAGLEVVVIDCDNGDVHYAGEHHNALGSTVASISIYANDGPQYDGTNRFSLLVTGTSVASYQRPYRSSWFGRYNSATSAVTPRVEVCRSGSSTAFNDDQLWGEWFYKGTSGVPTGTLVHDKRGLVASSAAQATGTLGAGDWTGESGTSWFGKLTPTSSITPAELGEMLARVAIAANATVYVDPQIRDV